MTSAALLNSFRSSGRLPAVALLAPVAFLIAVWPFQLLVVAAIGLVVALAFRSPGIGFALALALVGLEGSLKASLALGSNPFPVDPVALGAATLDLALAIGVAGVVVRDRGTTLRTVWKRLGRVERISAALVGIWVGASALQILQTGDPATGLAGFRLTQGYVLLAVAGIALVGVLGPSRVAAVLLVGLGAIAAYAAVRVVVGPSATEYAFAIGRPGVTQYGEVFRAVGSFSGAVGMASFVVPTGVFALGLAIFDRAQRRLAAGVFLCAAIAAIGSYSRAALVAFALGVLALPALGLGGALQRRRRLALMTASIVLLVGAGATGIASLASTATRERAAGILHPLRDRSMQMRFDTWRDSISAVEAHPNGTGLGTVGRATSLTGPTVTTDSSYLKIYREQGVLVGSVFVVGIFGLCIALIRRIRRIRHEPRPLAVSALAGFLAVLVMWTFGEFVEQPGKTVAWTFLGLALADATLDRVHSPASPLLTLDAVRRIAPTAARTRIVVFALAAVLLAIPIMLNIFRTAHYEASIEAVLESGSGRTLPSARSVAAVERFLRDRFVLASVVRTSHVPIKPASVGDDVRLGVSHGRLLIAARADSPDRATRLAAATGAALADASTRDPADWRVVLGPREAAPPPSGLVDRALSRLPGPLPPRPSLFWTVVAGAVLAAGLIAAWSSDHASR